MQVSEEVFIFAQSLILNFDTKLQKKEQIGALEKQINRQKE